MYPNVFSTPSKNRGDVVESNRLLFSTKRNDSAFTRVGTKHHQISTSNHSIPPVTFADHLIDLLDESLWKRGERILAES